MTSIFLFNPPGPDDTAFTREGRCTQESGVWGTQWPPVTLATAAAFLEADGHTVRVEDFPATGKGMAEMLAELERFRPEVAVWSTGTPTLASDLGIADRIRTIAPGTLTAVMGTHVSVAAAEVLATSGVDGVIRGEPEAVIRDICRNGRDGLSQVKGISFRHPEKGTVVHNDDAPFLAPEAIPSPAWHLLDLAPYRLPLKGRPFLIVAPIRGCPWPCSFCTSRIYYGRRLRKRPVDRVLDEIESNIHRHGVEDIFIWADTFTADARYVKDFCTAIRKRNLSIRWTCNSRVDTVDEALLAAMKEAGLWMISFGLESGDEGVLARCGKGIRPDQSKLAVEAAHRLGIKTSGHFIFGLPGETEATLRKTLRFALDLPLDIVQFYTAAPFPGTRLHQEAIKRGWLSDDGLLSQNQATLTLPGLPANRVDDFRKTAYLRYYLRPTALARLMSMVEPAAVFGITHNLKAVWHWIHR